MVKSLVALLLLTLSSLGGDKLSATFESWEGLEMEKAAAKQRTETYPEASFQPIGTTVTLAIPDKYPGIFVTIFDEGHFIKNDGTPDKGSSGAGSESKVVRPANGVIVLHSIGFFVKGDPQSVPSSLIPAARTFSGWSMEVRDAKRRVIGVFASNDVLRKKLADQLKFRLPRD